MSDTPMMKQYNSFKEQYPGKVLLYRMGDFYETFGDDAKLTSKILNITLTARDKSSDPTPLAGFPHHALENYLPKLVSAGQTVVIVDQIEDPKLAKGIVKRAVTRILTPGTLDGDLADESRNSYLVAVCRAKKSLSAGFLDLSTGELMFAEFNSENELKAALIGHPPAEILLIEGTGPLTVNNTPVQIVEKSSVEQSAVETLLKEFFKVYSVNSLGADIGNECAVAVSMLIRYVIETQKMEPSHISKPKRLSRESYMPLDQATVKNLELVYSANHSLKTTLFGSLDYTKTRMGKRLLYSWILSPLLKVDDIEARLEVVELFYKDSAKIDQIQEMLSGISDLSRIVGKIGLNRATARDYKAIEYSLQNIIRVAEILKTFDLAGNSYLDLQLGESQELLDLISKTIHDSPSNLITDGGIIREGFNAEVDELREITHNSKSWLSQFIEAEKQRTGISSLKIGFNKVFGYYLEITKIHHDKVPPDYIRKQTLVNSERYVTEELKQKEEIILGAQDKLSALEYRLFQQFRNETLHYLELLRRLGEKVAAVDVLVAFAEAARSNSYVRPTLFEPGEEAGIIEIVAGRHPVVEKSVDGGFISNDIVLNSAERRMNILTGPNMAGKSTFIRQVAIIVLMAQIGAFVPASSCRLAIVDRVFTRVGASDDLSGGRSTFMVEMDETANILNNATENSLIVLDEVGRGTSTYDGVSIAWSLAEYIAKVLRSRTLFATHYHELLDLAKDLPDAVRNLRVVVKEDKENEEIIFLRKIEEGGIDRSYGIYVAKMAGLPTKVVNRATEILKSFENKRTVSRKRSKSEDQITLL